MLGSKEIKDMLGLKWREQFRRVLPELRQFGAFKLPGGSWRMSEEDFQAYIQAKKEESKQGLGTSKP